jgi:signal transduction histidine kinase
MLSKYYSTKDYNASTQNWAIAQDNRGILYFGNASGILEFDGESWRQIKVTNKSTVRSLALDNNSILYVGAFNELGYLLPDQTGDLKYHSLTHLIDQQCSDFGEIWDINCFSDTVFFLTDNYIFRYENGKFTFWKNENERFYLSHKVNNKYLVQDIGKGLMIFSDDSFNLIENGEFFSNIRIHTILPIDNELLICTRNDGLFLYNRSNGGSIKSFSQVSPKTKRINDYFIKNSFYHGVELSDDLLAFGSILGDIVVLDRNWNVVDIINDGSIGIKSPTLYVHYQKNHSLWLALANGISQVEVMSPYRYWNEELGLSGVITDVARVRNILYISTGTGIYYAKSTDYDDFSLTSFNPVEGTFEQAWGFLYFKPLSFLQTLDHDIPNNNLGYDVNDKTLLLAATSRGVFQINESKSTNVANYNAVYTLFQSKSDPTKLLIGLNKGIALVSYNNGKWIDHGLQYGIDANIRSINEDNDGNIWLSASYKGLYRINNPFSRIVDSVRVELFDTSHGLESINSIRIFEEKGKLIFRCENNIFNYSQSDNKFQLFEHSSISNSSSTNTLQYIDTLSWHRVRGEIISNFFVTYHNDSVVWFGTNDGTLKHMGGTTRNYFDLPPTLIRRVISEDSILFNGTNYIEIVDENGLEKNYVSTEPSIDLGTILKYKSNSLTFNFSFPFFESEKKNLYSFFLEGYDHGWSEWNTETKKEYTNLREGSYTFKVKSKNLYGIESIPAEYHFKILPPWYRTFLAYLGYFTLFFIVIILVVKLYTYRLIKEKDKLEGVVKERTQEILMQKEEILVQAEHLRETYDWMRAKNIELEYQKKAFEKKKDQLEISNATKNKFFRIIAHDLRNPISTLVSSTGYILTDIEKFDKVKMKRIIEELNKLSLTTYNLLENLLDWSTSQMGEIRFDPKKVELISVVRENIELVKSNIDSKNIQIDASVPEGLSVLADENMVHNTIRNLITNAVKFTPDNGLIRVFTEVKDDYCSLNISDNGVGISKENLENLFRIDKHVSTPGTHNEKGSGLGLILCKEFVERNGGTISVTSELEKGSTFTISFKLA